MDDDKKIREFPIKIAPTNIRVAGRTCSEHESLSKLSCSRAMPNTLEDASAIQSTRYHIPIHSAPHSKNWTHM